MRIIVAIAFACLALTGCQTATVDQAISKNLPQVCSAATVAYTAFDAYASVATVSAKDERRVDAAWKALQPICLNPSSQTAGSVLVAAIGAYGTIALALKNTQH